MKSLIISEKDRIAAIMEDEKAIEFFTQKGELLLGDIYTAKVENIMPSIDAAFVNLGNNRMGFLHASDIPGQGNLHDRIQPNQKLLVQIVKEPTSNKGPRVNTAVTLPGRFLVMSTENTNVSISRKILDYQERNRLKAMVTLLKPPGIGLVVRTEAEGKDEYDLEEDFKVLWDRWKEISDKHENHRYPGLVYRDQDFLNRVIRDAYTSEIENVILDSNQGQIRAQDILKNWTGAEIEIKIHKEGNILSTYGVEKELYNALQKKVELPSGGFLIIETTEALSVIDVNSGRFTSSRTLRETVLKTNLESAHELARQLKLRNIGGIIVVDFIDMDNRKDRITVLEALENALMSDRAKPQVGQLSDLGLVELTRRRQGQSLQEVFGLKPNVDEPVNVNLGLSGELRKTRDRDGGGRNDRDSRGGDRDNNRRTRRSSQSRGRYQNRDNRSSDYEDKNSESSTDTSEETPDNQVDTSAEENTETPEASTSEFDSSNEFDNNNSNGEELSESSYDEDSKFSVKEEEVSGVFSLTPKDGGDE